jgi:hypothetical protein
VTVNRLDVVGDRVTRIDLAAPLILATAIILRVIKTRAEIGGWNKV